MPKPPEFTVRKLLHLAPEMVERIAEYRFSRRLGTEAEAIRALLEAGLRAEEARETRRKKR
jgi:hypothetical protein